MWSTIPISEQAHGSFTCYFLRKWSSLLSNFGAVFSTAQCSLHAQTVARGWTLTITSHSRMHVGLFQFWGLQSTLPAISECIQPTSLTSAEMTQKPAPFSRQTQILSRKMEPRLLSKVLKMPLHQGFFPSLHSLLTLQGSQSHFLIK